VLLTVAVVVTVPLQVKVTGLVPEVEQTARAGEIGQAKAHPNAIAKIVQNEAWRTRSPRPRIINAQNTRLSCEPLLDPDAVRFWLARTSRPSCLQETVMGANRVAPNFQPADKFCR
jgi:hypothetical protein